MIGGNYFYKVEKTQQKIFPEIESNEINVAGLASFL